MSSLDKIYGTRTQWKALRKFLIENGKEEWVRALCEKPPRDGGKYVYRISNFYYEQDKWLIHNCPLPFVQKRLMEQYPNGFNDEIIREAREYLNLRSYDDVFGKS